jgi:hypothetical protein
LRIQPGNGTVAKRKYAVAMAVDRRQEAAYFESGMHEVPMRFLLKSACFGGIFAIAAAASVVAAPPAYAFTMENGDGTSSAPSGGTGSNFQQAPKWDLEEQAKQFQNGSTASAAAGKNQFSTPFGNGTVQFGVQQHNFSTTPTFGAQSGATRQNFDRMLAPPGLQHLYDQ